MITLTDPRQFAFTADGLSTMATLYRIPAAFFTLTIPFFALMAASHRSEQTKQQMKLTRAQIARTDSQIQITAVQNVFANHYKHVEEFEKYLLARHQRNDARIERVRKIYEKSKSPFQDLIKPDYAINPVYYRNAYRHIFPNSKNGDFSISLGYLDEMEKFVANVRAIFSEFSKPSSECWGRAMIKLYDVVHEYSSSQFIDITVGPATRFTWGNETREIYCGYGSVLIMQAMDVIEAQIDALQFDVSYHVSDSVGQFISMDRTTIPDLSVEDFAGCPIDLSLVRSSPLPYLN